MTSMNMITYNLLQNLPGRASAREGKSNNEQLRKASISLRSENEIRKREFETLNVSLYGLP